MEAKSQTALCPLQTWMAPSRSDPMITQGILSTCGVAGARVHQGQRSSKEAKKTLVERNFGQAWRLRAERDLEPLR